MPVTATEDAIDQLTGDTVVAEQPTQVTLVIDRFDHWHNQDVVMLRPTSITWGDHPTTIAGRAA